MRSQRPYELLDKTLEVIQEGN